MDITITLHMRARRWDFTARGISITASSLAWDPGQVGVMVMVGAVIVLQLTAAEAITAAAVRRRIVDTTVAADMQLQRHIVVEHDRVPDMHQHLTQRPHMQHLHTQQLLTMAAANINRGKISCV